MHSLPSSRDPDGVPLKIVKFASDVTAEVIEQRRRAETQMLVGHDLSGIADAAKTVAEQAADARRSADGVLRDVRSATERAEELLQSAKETADQVAQSGSVVARAVDETRTTQALIAALDSRGRRYWEGNRSHSGDCSADESFSLECCDRSGPGRSHGPRICGRRAGGEVAGRGYEGRNGTNYWSSRLHSGGDVARRRRHQHDSVNNRCSKCAIGSHHDNDVRPGNSGPRHESAHGEGLE